MPNSGPDNSLWWKELGPWAGSVLALFGAIFRWRKGHKRHVEEESVGLASLHAEALQGILDRQIAEIKRLEDDNERQEIEIRRYFEENARQVRTVYALEDDKARLERQIVLMKEEMILIEHRCGVCKEAQLANEKQIADLRLALARALAVSEGGSI